MRIKSVTEAQASTILLAHGLEVIIWTTCSIDVGRRQAIICDYSGFSGPVKFAVVVYDGDGRLIDRLNVMK